MKIKNVQQLIDWMCMLCENGYYISHCLTNLCENDDNYEEFYWECNQCKEYYIFFSMYEDSYRKCVLNNKYENINKEGQCNRCLSEYSILRNYTFIENLYFNALDKEGKYIWCSSNYVVFYENV